jgi:hypothetical protein
MVAHPVPAGQRRSPVISIGEDISGVKGYGCRLEGVNRRFKTFTSGLTNAE